MNHECIRYSVDPGLLNGYADIEQLEKTNVRLFKPQLNYKNFCDYAGNPKYLFIKKSKHNRA